MPKPLTDKPQTYLLFILLIILLSGAVESKADPLTVEYKVKAGFLFNFFNFVSWPEDQLPKDGAPLTLCVVADGLAAKTISDQLDGRRVLSRRLQVSRGYSLQQLNSCQMVFISAARSGLRHKIISSLKGKSILTVSESKDFAADGGIINFTKEKSKIRLQINQAAAAQAHLKISSKLLRVAKTVINTEAGEVKQ